MLIILLATVLLAATVPVRVRREVGAGIWYPADPAALRAAVEQYTTQSETPQIPGRLVACIVPHASYQACGAVAGAAFKSVRPGQYDRVVMLAPAEYATFDGLSIPSVQVYRTPLGDVPLDGPAIRRLTVCPFISLRSVVYRAEAYSDPRIGRVALHERETAIEIVLPFLQVRLGDFKLIPILVGSLANEHGKRDETAFKRILGALREVLDDRTLVVVCSNFTRYGEVHGYTPFRDNVLDGITVLDMEAFDLIRNRDRTGFDAYLQETGNKISGKDPITLLLRLLPAETTGMLLDYEISGRITGKPDPSISFASLAFFDAAQSSPAPDETTSTGGDRNARHE